MTTFTKSSEDGTLAIDIHMQDGVESFSGKAIDELAEILESTAKWLRTMINEETDEGRDRLEALLHMTGES